MEPNLHYKQQAAHQSWHAKSLRNLLIDLIDEFPKADDRELLKIYKERSREDDDYFDAVHQYGVLQTLSTLERRQERAPQQKAAAAKQKVELEAEIKAKVESIKEQILLLNLPMPNGKLMRYCTGAELEQFGAGYQRIARKVGKTAKVGEKLNEEQVRKLMGA